MFNKLIHCSPRDRQSITQELAQLNEKEEANEERRRRLM